MTPLLPPFDPWQSVIVASDVAAASRDTPQRVAQRQQRRLSALFVAARRSRRYAEVIGGRDPATLRLDDFPIQRKRSLMAGFDDWVCDPAVSLSALRAFMADPARIAEPFLGRYTVWESSGSTGEPGVFVQDAAAMAVYDALEALRRPVVRPLRRWLDPWALTDRMAFVGALGGHFASTVSIERLRRLNLARSSQLRSVSFLQPVAAIDAELDALQPTVLATYPSVAALLAEERLQGRLHITPAEVWTGGETLTAGVRRQIRQAFGGPVVDSYGASECLALASECAAGALHLNADWAILEPVDEVGRAVPLGRPGATTLLTNLANHVQPLIRYDLGDRVTLHAPGECRCGSPLPVVEVDGRDDDTLRLPRADGELRLAPLAVSTVLEDEAGLYDFQLVQRGPRDLLLRTGLGGVGGEQALQRGRAALLAFLQAQGLHGVSVEGQTASPVLRGRSGKLPRVVVQRPRH